MRSLQIQDYDALAKRTMNFIEELQHWRLRRFEGEMVLTAKWHQDLPDDL